MQTAQTSLYLDPALRVLNFFDRSHAPTAGDRGYAALSSTVKSIDAKRHAIHAVMASDREDRYGEVIDVAGFADHLDTFRSNPQLLFGHDHSLNIGEWRNVQIKDHTLEGWAFFDDGDEFAMKIFGKYQRKFMRAFSVGFIAHQHVMDKVGKGKEQRYRRRFTETELMECSACTIPANPDALAKAFGVQADPREFDQDDSAGLSNRRLNKQLARSLPKALGGSVQDIQRMIEDTLEADCNSPLGCLIEQTIEKTSLKVANAIIDQLNQLGKKSSPAKGGPLLHIDSFDLDEPLGAGNPFGLAGENRSTTRDADDVDAMFAR